MILQLSITSEREDKNPGTTCDDFCAAQEVVKLVIWVWLKIKDMGAHRYKSIFSINCPFLGVPILDPCSFTTNIAGSMMFMLIIRL